jgi:Family of unknown function (DUF5683)
MLLKSCFGIRLILFLLIGVSIQTYGQDSPVKQPAADTMPVINNKKPADTVPGVKIEAKSADSVKKKKQSSDTDTARVKKKKGEAGKAALRSAIIPGWGQAYNKKYWKIPIVYGALAIPVATFIYNKNWYEKTKYAYQVKYYNDTAAVDIPTDDIDPQLEPLSTGSVQQYRNSFRQGMDFSILAFLAVWGLQVADAAVDGHLKTFNINDDLSLKVKPYVTPGRSNGVSMVFMLRDNKPKMSVPSY